MRADYQETIDLFAPLLGEEPARRVAWFALPRKSKEFTDELQAFALAPRLTVWAQSYDIQKIMGGMAGLRYST